MGLGVGVLIWPVVVPAASSAWTASSAAAASAWSASSAAASVTWAASKKAGVVVISWCLVNARPLGSFAKGAKDGWRTGSNKSAPRPRDRYEAAGQLAGSFANAGKQVIKGQLDDAARAVGKYADDVIRMFSDLF
jgi:hypothetical protein